MLIGAMAADTLDTRAPRALVGWRRLAETAALAAAIFLTARFCMALPHGMARASPVWLPNAVALTALLNSRARRWPVLAAVFLAALMLAGVTGGYPLALVAVRVAANALEVVATAILVRRLAGPGLDMEQPRHLGVLCGAGVVCALAAGVLQAAAIGALGLAPPLVTLQLWSLSHPLALLAAAPCLLVLTRPQRYMGGRRFTLRATWALTAMAAVACLVFSQSRFPLLFLAPAALLWVSLEAGLYGAAIAVLITAAVALPTTMAGVGPIALSRGDVAERGAVLQLFLAISLFSSLPVAALQARWRKAQDMALEEARRARRAEAAAAEGEARHRSLTDRAPDAIGAMDLSGRLTFVSPAVEAIAGYTPEELTGARLIDFVAPEDRPRLRDNLLRLLEGGQSGDGSVEYRLRRKDGAWVWLQASPRLVKDAAGEPVGTVDVVRDVSARKAMEMELEAAVEAAQAAAHAKSDFLANMSHELRTPLTGILGYAEVMWRDPDLPETNRRQAERIRTAGAMLLALVNDVLDLSRAEAGGVTLHPRATDLREVLHASVDMLRPQAQQASLALCVEDDGAAPPVLVDGARLQQVLVNLLGNAVKFTPRGVVTASLRREVVGDEVGVRLSVTDTGIGIARERLEHVFDRFEQADGSISRSYGGAGLGLAISRTLVRAMGGSLHVESTPGAGSVFTVRLRLPVVLQDAARVQPEPPQDGAEGADGLRGLRVLLAEDVPVNRDVVTLMLSPLGVRLHAVADGLQAVEAAAAQPFDVVLMDMQMPVMDGLDATRRIRAGGGPSAAARIVALTANVMPEEVERCLAAGMDDHLSKPLAAGDLVAQLRRGATRGGAVDDAGRDRAAA